MQIIFLSTNQNLIDEWQTRHSITENLSCYDIESLKDLLSKSTDALVVADYDSVAHEINSLISSSALPPFCVVLEKSPAIATGKMLIMQGVKGYGNSRMQNIHFKQLIATVSNGDIWTYPELTAALAQTKRNTLNPDAMELLKSRLTQKEQEVVMLVLEGLTNDAISKKLNITTRTVKAHISSIFMKLHVNDRISLVLLLK